MTWGKLKSYVLQALGVIAILNVAHVFAWFYVGPHNDVTAAFETYRQAHATKSTELEASLTSPSPIKHFETLRQHALYSPAHVVKSLGFKDRKTVLGMRCFALLSGWTVEDIAETPVADLYARWHATFHGHFDTVADMKIIATMSAGHNKVRGYVSTINHGNKDFRWQYVTPILAGTFVEFEKIDKHWVVNSSVVFDQTIKRWEDHIHEVDGSVDDELFTLLSVPSEICDRCWLALSSDFVT